jgi:hypothetical protein
VATSYPQHTQRFPFAVPDYLGGVSFFDGWSFGPVVAFGAVAGEPLGLPRSGPAIMPVVLSKLVILPLLLLVMPLVKVLPRTPACEVGRLCVVCCAMAVVPNKASRPTARESFFIPSSTKKPAHRCNMHPELIVCPSLPGEMGSLHLDVTFEYDVIGPPVNRRALIP